MTTAILTVDRTGRVVLPKPIRDQLGLAAGSELRIAATADQITLEPVHHTAAVEERDGWLVHTGTLEAGQGDIIAAIRQSREERNTSVFPGKAAR